MNLVRVEIGAFGGMSDCSLDGLSGGLTVVLGPNEAGKSTYAALVRQILYGFPDKRHRNHGYVPRGGVRRGRLIFADGSGEWAIERVDGPKRGPVSVTAIRGGERPGLLDEITGTVSEETYRIVFGFGLDELKDVGATDNDAVAGRLYAGAHGLRVNLMDVSGELSTAAGQLFKAGRGKAAINDALSELKAQQAVVRELQAQARAFGAEQQQRLRIEEQLAPLKTRRSELDQRVRTLVRELEQARTVADGRRELVQRAEELEGERARAKAAFAELSVNEELLAVEPEIEALLAEEAVARERMTRAAEAEARIAELVRTVAALEVGEASDSAQARSRLEAWRDRRARIQAEADAFARSASSARGRAESLAAADAASGASPKRDTTQLMIAVGLVVLGLGSAAAGVVLAQSLAIALGAMVAAAGAVLLLLASKQPAADRTLSVEAARLFAEADASERAATDARAMLERESVSWAEYLAEAGLDARGTEPASVLALLDDARSKRDLEQQIGALRAEAQRDSDAAKAWNEGLGALVLGPLGLTLEQGGSAAALSVRARDGLEEARKARARRDEAHRRRQSLDSESEQVDRKLRAADEQLAALASRYKTEGDVVAALEAKIAETESELELTREQYEELAREHTRLETRLDEQGRDASMARAQQRVEGLRARIVEDADRYLVEATALRLLEMTRERFERERQPEVLRSAGRVFRDMTAGRYVDVRASLNGGELSVVNERDEALRVEQLSRGTAEQLYLALRVGLIESFGEQGPHLPVLMDDIGVNFDDERRAAACVAVAELAQNRQVVFFTCHDSTAVALADALPGATTLVLDRCAL